MSENLFKRKMENKNTNQLLHLINNKDQFRAEAVEAAREVLNERENESQLPDSKLQQKKVSASKNDADSEEKIKTHFSLRAIASYQVVSSLLIMPSIYNLFPKVINSAKNTAILICLTLLYLAGLVSAALIFKKKYEGLMVALIFNICQSLYLQIGSFAFFSTGFFYIIFTLPFGFNFNFGQPSFLLSFSQSGGFTIGFNIVSCIAVSFLMNAMVTFDEKEKFPEHLY